MSQLPKNTHDGAKIATVERLGYVPPCVKDALSWLPYPYGIVGRGKKAFPAWQWQAFIQDRKVVLNPDAQAPESCPSDGKRCHRCIFQEPEWSQNYAMCCFSWLNDRDEDCQAFLDRDEFIASNPQLKDCCLPPGLEISALATVPYRRDGKLYASFGPSTNLPNHYAARLNFRDWYESKVVQSLYWGLCEAERTRRFWQWAREETLHRKGVVQLNMFLDL